MEKRPLRGLPSFRYVIARFSRAFLRIRMLLPLAAAERQERSD